MSMAVVDGTRRLAWQARQAMIFAKNVFPTRVSDQHNSGAFLKKAEIRKAEDAILRCKRVL